MKYLKSIKENIGQQLHIVWYTDDEMNTEIIGVFNSPEDCAICILNYVNNEVQDLYNDGEEEELKESKIKKYTKEKDENGHYIFIDSDEAIEWFNERGGNGNGDKRFQLSTDINQISKPELDQRIKDYLEIKRYNL